MDKYKLEKLRQQYDEARLAYYAKGVDCRLEYLQEYWYALKFLKDKYFSALDEMSRKEGEK